MKKLVACLMSVCLLAVMILPAAASDAGLETRLAKVTLATKKTLGIGDEYKEFTGALNEGTVKLWNLSWRSDTSSIDVSVTESGKVVSYSLSFQEDSNVRFSKGGKAFSKSTQKEAKKLAQEFVSKLLDAPLETCELEEISYFVPADTNNYNFSGTIQLNGKKTPLNARLCVDSTKKVVTSFYRNDDGTDYHSYPANAKVSMEDANKTLYSALEMKLNYVVSEKDAKHAILQYTPQMKGDYVVDAMTGALLERGYPIMYRDYHSPRIENAKNAAMGGLTEVEGKAVSELKGCLSAKDLEANARAVSELGITSGFALDSVSYCSEKKDKETLIYANLNFVKTSKTPESRSTKTVMLNAKTGAFYAVYGYDWRNQDVKSSYSRAESEKIARSFAQKYNPEELKLTVLAEPEPEVQDQKNHFQSFSFVRQVNDIAFPDNAITITVDTSDGTIVNYSASWDKDITFASAKNIKTEQEAKAIFQKEAGINLCYDQISKDKTGEKYELKLVYAFANPNVWGVDPVTGKPLVHQQDQKIRYAYRDITGHFAQKQIEMLAEYGIGYAGEAFHPDQSLTQKDALLLIVPACGYALYPNAENFEDSLYSDAYTLGILNKSERNPSASVTRAELTKLLVNSAGYGEVAKLKDIYRVGYKDDKSIPKDLVGYVAIAKGMGIVQGNANGKFNPNGVSTRAQLAIMLYNLLNH